ncbi:WHG domain-containing protein [Sporolactobacillus sp. STSJ-5]|uniref:TetR-like C-terminal domain-containing protein n=1 Tax=Sporolactobacillus sp. STSJ-5 TaxID=2965076 RepID=UPI002105B77C|nr:TetR-like C-terminal domain-containing protein [Sporolactobacillus sp. STSJ-5]MCQ2009634.1 WHG domain-containing protein [Sporolactobacillus sp. STSJ-5]
MRQGLTKQQIIKQAAQQIEETGLHNLTLAALAQRLHIKTPSLYNHINNLTDLRNGLSCYGLSMLTEKLIQSALGKSQDDALFAIAGTYIAFAKEHPNLYDAIIHVPDPTDPDLHQIAERLLNFLFKILEGYPLSEEDRVHAVRGLRSIVHGFASLQLHQGFNMKNDQDESLKWILSAYLAGLKLNLSNKS